MSRTTHRAPTRAIAHEVSKQMSGHAAPVGLEAGTIRHSVSLAGSTLEFLEQSVEELEKRVGRPPEEEAKAGAIPTAGPRSSIADEIDRLEIRLSRLAHRIRYAAEAI